MRNRNGFYFWEQEWNNTNYYWQLQLCEDIWNQNISSCVNPSPVNQITTDLKTCVSAGQTAGKIGSNTTDVSKSVLGTLLLLEMESD